MEMSFYMKLAGNIRFDAIVPVYRSHLYLNSGSV